MIEDSGVGAVSDSVQAKFDNYDIHRQLGSGPRSLEFLGRHCIYDLEVTLKVLKSRKAEDKERFIREVRLLFSFNHPHIAPARDCGISRSGFLYFTTDKLSGMNLRDWMKRYGCIEPILAVQTFLKVLSAVEYAHERGVLHRDLCPDNIVVEHIGEEFAVSLTGFGVAKLNEDPIDQSDIVALTDLNLLGGLKRVGLGREEYMAPELAYSEASQRSEVFSLSVTLFEMLAGLVPWSENSDAIWVDKNPSSFKELMVSRGIEIPESLWSIVAEGLELQTSKRMSSVSVMHERLEGFLREELQESDFQSMLSRIFSPLRRKD